MSTVSPSDLRYSRVNLQPLQALRAVAAMAVVFYHANIYLYQKFLTSAANVQSHELPIPALHMGYAGVEIFFVLSGFIMYYVHVDDFGRPGKAVNFIKKRLQRIFPFFWLVLFAVLVLHFKNSDVPSVSRIVESAFLLPVETRPIIQEAWSLKFELVFYFMFLSFILNRKFGALVSIVWLSLVIVYWLTGFDGWGGDLIFSTYCTLFFMGIGSAVFFTKLPRASAVVGFYIGLAGYLVIGLAEAYDVFAFEPSTRTMFYGVGASLMVAGLANLGLHGAWAVPKTLVFLGDASYSIYLVHHIFLAIVGRTISVFGLNEILPASLLIVGASIVAIVGSTFVYVIVERPLLAVFRSGSLRRCGQSLYRQS